MPSTTLTDLPPELLDHITTYLPVAGALANLGATSKSLRTFVEKDAWQTFARTRFPSLSLAASSLPYKDVVRTLTTLSKAWDRRAFLARFIEPHGDITSHPGGSKVERWKRPQGQTIGFTPQVDVYEEVGPRWQDRKEVFAFSAGAEVCVREQRRGGNGKQGAKWMTYRPLSAYEGRDDVTTLHLLRPGAAGQCDDERQHLVAGTANGDLCILCLPAQNKSIVPVAYCTTQGLPVRATSLLQESGHQQTLLAANLGDSRISLYSIDVNHSKIAPVSSIDIRPPESSIGHLAKHQRVWSTQFLSSQHLAVGLGPSDEPILVYAVTPSGLSTDPVRKFSLQNELDASSGEIALAGSTKKTTSSVYPIIPLPALGAEARSQASNSFLSGAYDGIIRLHDMRSSRQVEQSFVDPTDDSAIYSLLARGQEKLVVGTSRHSLLKVFDLRLGAKCYDYLDAQRTASPKTNGASEHARGRNHASSKDWNLFLKPTTRGADWRTGRGGRGRQNWSRQRTAESSIYSLASPSSCSPYIFAGVENAVLELEFTSALDTHPDPVVVKPWTAHNGGRQDSWRTKEVLDLAMHDQTPDMKLHTQKNLWETWRSRQSPSVDGLDERWRVGSG